MPDKSKDVCEENCRIFIPVENNLFVLLAKFITSEIKLPPGIQLLAASSAYQLFIFGDATEDQFPGLFTFDFRYCFFSANRNGTFENSQNLVSIYQPTCGSDKSGRPEPEAVKFTREQVRSHTFLH